MDNNLNAPNTYPPSSSSNPPSKIKIVLPLVILAFFIFAAGGFLGYKISNNSKVSKTTGSVPLQTKEQPKDLLGQRLEEIVTNPKAEYKSLVNSMNVEIELKGKVAKVENTTKERAVGRNVTLENGPDQITIFVRESASAYEGDFNTKTKNGWVYNKDKPINVGDNIIIRANAPIENANKAASFAGWWYFRQL